MREHLSDCYVGMLLTTLLLRKGTNIHAADIPPEVIRLKKGLLMLKRLLVEKELASFRGMHK